MMAAFNSLVRGVEMYVLGLDVGGTKTLCAVADEKGYIVAEGFGGCGNYQICGIEAAQIEIQRAIDDALKKAKISIEFLKYAVLGISGADRIEDYDILVPAIKSIMKDIKFKIVHDTLIGLRAGTEDFVGVVSICGTGAGHAGRNRQGKELILRNLDYRTGNYGGGEEVVQQALHYAFRSEEGTWEKSELENIIPKIFNVENINDVCSILMNKQMTKEQRFHIPIAVFSLAEKGDEVSRSILREMGYQEGKYAAAILRRLEMCNEIVPIVLIGSLFRVNQPILIDAYMEVVHEEAPKAYAMILDEAPVIGAVKMALDCARGEK